MFLAVACAFQVQAAEDSELQSIVITATKSAKNTADAPAAVSIISTKDIEDKNIHSIDQALTLVPGAYTSRPGGNEPSVMGTHVMLRGIPDASRTLVLVDGQTLNDPYIGTVTWESVPAETVKRIEVVPGPFSSLYGGSAMGGVINIITTTPTKRDISFKGGMGTNGFKSGTLVYQDRLGENVGIILDYGYKRSDGYVKDLVVYKACSKNCGTAVPASGAEATTDSSGNAAWLVGDKGANAWSSQNLGVKLYVDLSAQSKLTASASQLLYSSFDRNQFNSYLRDAAGKPISNVTVTVPGGTALMVREKSFLTGPDSEIKEYKRYSMEYERKLAGGGNFKATLGYADMPLYNNYIVPGSGATLNGGAATRMLRPSNEVSGSVQSTRPVFDNQLLVVGLSAVKRSIDTVTYNITDWRDAGAIGPIQNQTSGEDMTYALYAQDEIMLSERLTAYIGGRYDMWSTSGVIQQVATPGAYLNEYGSRSQSHFSPKASLVYRPSDATTLRSSVGTSFHTPNLRDTFGWWTPTTGYVFNPNPDLKPETVTSWELGFEQKLPSGTFLRATYFENSLKDLIYRTESTALMTQGVENAGKAMVKGIELEVSQPLMTGLTAFANLTLNDPKITENAAKPLTVGKYMTNTPRKMANIGLQGTSGPWSGSIAGHYLGEMFANEENKDVVSGVYGSYDAAFVADAKISYKLNDKTALSLSVNNLTDKKYFQSSLAEGRTFYAELSMKF